MNHGSFVSFSQVTLKDGFWKDRYDLNRHVSVPNVARRFEETGRFDALRFNFLKNGKKLHIFYDSDAAKWMEAVAYLIRKDRNGYPAEEALVDELADAMEAAQRPDGYLNSYHQQIDPKNILQIRDHHELYCLGHLIEAAVAYHEATGKGKLLAVVERYCDMVEKAFFTEKTAAFETPGHEEIELALFKLYRYTGKERYRAMAEGFLRRRGRNPDEQYIHFDIRTYSQDDTVIEELAEANGHSVRALYLYSGIADMAYENRDTGLKEVLDRVYDDIVNRKMYITGGVGSTHRGESFTVAYDLPNHTAYAESCCAVAMIMFALRMRRMEKNARFGHLIERVMYNSLLSSTTLDGKGFFYVNPLEIALEERNRERGVAPNKREWQPITTRVEVFNCSCCPPNINRIFAELGDVICFDEKDHACVEQWIPSVVESAHGTLSLSGSLVTEGTVTLSSDNYRAATVAVRLPEWSRRVTVSLNGNPVENCECRDGYAYFQVGSAFQLTFDFHIAPVFLAANPKVRANVGRMALTYGPMVYCLEGVDNGERLNQISVSAEAVRNAVLTEDFHGFLSIEMDGCRDVDTSALYFDAAAAETKPVRLKFIPYFAFANRGESDMLVWVRRA